VRVPQHDASRTTDRGASLVEVVIACVLLGILSAAVLSIVMQTQAAGVNNRNRVAAANLAAREIDIVRAEFSRSDAAPLAIANAGTVTNARPLEGGVTGRPLVVDGTSYTVRTSAQWNITGSGQSACDGGSLVIYPTLGVTVTVTWPNMGSIKPVVSSAALAPEKGTGIPSTDSFVAIRITDSAGEPNPGRAVSVTGGGSTRNGTTDAQGCAVLQVSPASGLGTDYTARVTDAGYVDISGAANTSKAVGKVAQGQLNNNVLFQIDRAATANLRLVDEAGAPLAASAAAGAQITLVASESSGSTNSRTITATGPVTTVTGLWPTNYGAYFGTTAPSGGFTTQKAEPGATITMDVVFAAARLRLTALPAGTATVYAAPNGTTSCTAAGVRTVDPNAVSLLPGTWSFFVSGPTFVCSPGPAAVVLASGDNGERVWGETTLKVDNAPTGVIWAVNRARLGATVTTCPGASAGPIAVNIDGARSAPVVIPAGDWYVYVTDGAATGACRGVPPGQYSKVLTYDVDNVLTWANLSSRVTMGGSISSSSTRPVYGWTGATSMTCTAAGGGAGSTLLTRSSSGIWSGTFAPGTWRFFQKNNSGSGCTYGGTVVVDGSGVAYTLQFNTANPPSGQ
jgi:Tfp pilus assembly protein PilV